MKSPLINSLVIKSATIAVALLGSLATAANATSIVAPNANATVEGDVRASTAPLNDSSRFQQIVGSSQFGSSPIMITQIAFRPDSTQAAPFSINFSNLRLDLSTTSVAVGSLNSTFASNIGANNTTVFDQGITLSSANLPGPGNTKQFDIIITFTTPFLYDPSAGNLLLDLTTLNPDSTGFIDGQTDSTGTITAVVFADNDPNATMGLVQPAGVVVQFTTTGQNAPLTITGAVSRKTHGAQGDFDLPLILAPAGSGTVEPRAGGPTTLVFTFSEDVEAADGMISSNEFTITNATYSSASISGNMITLNLINVIDQSVVSVTLNGISDTSNNALTGDSDVEVRALFGDANQDQTVDKPDLQGINSHLGQTLDQTNYLDDLNLDGAITRKDGRIVQMNKLHTVP
ncbi:MAG: hypothetical protein H0X40_05290 [Chthoniobacterales bacterium]|nr:hypothetical protein [Chthoniobacterales bacterium]